ncbi:hypothetical protein H920_08173 [Fukomys damarensis]|uniref:Uncharacterized protein n=1 Tax=Fukomys damarensis TaxID=885580 RepID=A0A091DHB4_FUKDA|nr:hypothetical protein H920_08173 [Fukomys damarensis]
MPIGQKKRKKKTEEEEKEEEEEEEEGEDEKEGYWLFPKVKMIMKGKHFESVQNINTERMGQLKDIHKRGLPSSESDKKNGMYVLKMFMHLQKVASILLEQRRALSVFTPAVAGKPRSPLQAARVCLLWLCESVAVTRHLEITSGVDLCSDAGQSRAYLGGLLYVEGDTCSPPLEMLRGEYELGVNIRTKLSE